MPVTPHSRPFYLRQASRLHPAGIAFGEPQVEKDTAICHCRRARRRELQSGERDPPTLAPISRTVQKVRPNKARTGNDPLQRTGNEPNSEKKYSPLALRVHLGIRKKADSSRRCFFTRVTHGLALPRILLDDDRIAPPVATPA